MYIDGNKTVFVKMKYIIVAILLYYVLIGVALGVVALKLGGEGGIGLALILPIFLGIIGVPLFFYCKFAAPILVRWIVFWFPNDLKTAVTSIILRIFYFFPFVWGPQLIAFQLQKSKKF